MASEPMLAVDLTTGDPEYWYAEKWRCENCGNPIEYRGVIWVHVRGYWGEDKLRMANWGRGCPISDGAPGFRIFVQDGRVAEPPDVARHLADLEHLDLDDDG